MTRLPTAPCAGCGKLMHHTRGSLPVGQMTCHDCRAERRKNQACQVCGATFTVEKLGPRARRTCSPPCRAVLLRRVHVGGHFTPTARACRDCGTSTTRSPNSAAGPLCDDCRKKRRRAHNRRKNVARRGAAIVGRQMSIEELCERDGYRCHLCRRRVNLRLRSPHPRSATFDHLVPVSAGGTDDPANLALAHRDCNTRRGARGTVQLALIG